MSKRYYYQYIQQDSEHLVGPLSCEGWKIFDRQWYSQQGEEIPIAHCINVHVAKRIRDALNHAEETS